MAKKLHLVHVKSNVLDKAPSASTLNYGEIAVNYNAESPALYIKDDEDNIVKFISEPYFLKIVGTGVTENDGETITPISEIIQQDELTVSSALNDLNDRKADKSYVDSAISSVTIDVDTELDSASTNPVENRVITQVILDNEETVAAALNDLNDRKADKEYVDEAVSSITIDIDSELDTASTNPVENRVITQVILDNEETVAAALNDLNDRKADKEYVDEVVSSITIDVDSELDSASTNPVENQAITNALLDVEETVAAALNDLNDRKADISYVDEAVSSITIDIDSELDSASTNPLENRAIYAILEEDEQAIAAALNDLNDAINDLDRKVTITGVTESGSGNVITDAYLEDGVLNIEFGEIQVQNDTFKAVYGTTTAAEVRAAIASGKFVYTVYNDKVYTFSVDDGTAMYFYTIDADNTDLYELSLGNVGWDSYTSSHLSTLDPGTLCTTATTSQATSSGESLGNNIDLHKISKTGSYNDLVDAPTNLEVTTNKVTAITSTNTNTQYASAKATYDEIHPAIITTGGTSATITVEPNVLYSFGTLTGTKTFALATPGDSSVVNHYYWTFDTSATAPTITWPSGLTWYGGSAPTLSVSKHYEISVINGIAISMEV